MKNSYLFFKGQSLEEIDLTGYSKQETAIPKTKLIIMDFEYTDGSCVDDEERARKLDELTIRLQQQYPNAFKVINSESSQFFCSQLYPLVVDFETKLRKAFYISCSLFKNGDVTEDSFLLNVDKEKKAIEEIDFGKIYQSIFTDETLHGRVQKRYSGNLTKSDLIKMIQAEPESTMWHNWVGSEYGYIEKHFLEIQGYRNEVMHNHMIDIKTYQAARRTLQKANQELDKAVEDKLITNDSKYLNDYSAIEAMSMFVNAMLLATERWKKAMTSEGMQKFLQLFIDSGALTLPDRNQDETKLGDKEDE